MKIIEWLKEKTERFYDFLSDANEFVIGLDERTMLISFSTGLIIGFCLGRI